MRVRYEDNYGREHEQEVVATFTHDNNLYVVIKEPFDERHPFRTLYVDSVVHGTAKNTKIFLANMID